MFLTKKHLSRRHVLRGAGAAIGLPLLDAMIPAGTAFSAQAAAAATAAAPRTRLGFVYFAHGAVQRFWQPQQVGRDFEFSHILKPLEPLRSHVTVVSGLRNKGAENSPSPHFTTEVSWLTCVNRNGRTPDGQLGISVDQFAARHIGQDTPLPSLELCTEPGGYSSLSYRTPVQQLEMESNPRKVFYRLFGQGDTRDQRHEIVQTTGSLLDYVKDAADSLYKDLDAADCNVVKDYLESVRESERRVQKMKAAEGQNLELPEAPLGAPDDFTEHIDLQFELMALAWQTNQTRIATMRIVNEVSMRVYSWLGVSEAFHPLSHHGEDPEKVQRLLRVQVYHTERLAKFARRLAAIREGNSTLLDNAAILFGSNMANSDLHDADPVPSLVLGRAGGAIKGNQHLHYPQSTPHANLLVTLAQRVGVPLEKMADSTGVLSEV
jgi:hypothetical protein